MGPVWILTLRQGQEDVDGQRHQQNDDPEQLRSSGHNLARRLLVVEERHREERHRVRILRRERLGWTGADDGLLGGAVERVDRRRGHDVDVGDLAVLVDVELNDDVAAEAHGGVRDEPVPLHLRHEAPDPRAELHALGIKLNRRSGIGLASLRIVERLVLDVLLQVSQGTRT